MFTCVLFTPTDIIEIIGIIASLITSIVAIVISVKTLKQNSEMIEKSTRPYIVIYTRTTNFQSSNYYLIVKNFGQTGATVTSMKCDYDLSLCSYDARQTPFEHFNGTFIAPGQSFVGEIDHIKFFQNPKDLHFSIEYNANGKTYFDSFTINPKADSDLIQTRAATDGKELRTISYALQDLVEKQL